MRIDINNPVNVLVVNPYASIQLAKGLTFRSNLSITKSNARFKSFTPRRPEIGKPVLSNSLVERADDTNDILAEQVLNYKTSFDKHQLDLTGGYTFQKQKEHISIYFRAGFDMVQTIPLFNKCQYHSTFRKVAILQQQYHRYS
jgi:hypothetical protein